MENEQNSSDQLTVESADNTLEMPVAETAPEDSKTAEEPKQKTGLFGKPKKQKPIKVKRSAKGWITTILGFLIAGIFALCTVGYATYYLYGMSLGGGSVDKANDTLVGGIEAIRNSEITEADRDAKISQVEQVSSVWKDFYSEVISDFPEAASKFKDMWVMFFKVKTNSPDLHVTMGDYKDEPLNWLVVAADGDKKLLVCEKAVTAMSFGRGNRWDTSRVRQYLNGAFVDEAFSEEERSKIIEASLVNDCCEDTVDSVFLLSETEVNQYLLFDELRSCAPSSFAVDQGVSIQPGEGGYCDWWVRDSSNLMPIKEAALAATSSSYKFVKCSNSDSLPGVRPAMWVTA